MVKQRRKLSRVLATLLAIANVVISYYYVEAGALPKIIQSGTKSYKKNVGEEVRLRCKATGAQEDTDNRTLFFWKNQFGLIRQDRSRWPRFDIQQNKFLKISNIQPRDAGVYTCTATNEFGSSNAKRVLRVFQDGKEIMPVKPKKKRRPARKRLPAHVVKFMKGNKIAPKIIIGKRARHIREHRVGENAKLKCLVNAADPPPVITWTKDGKSLQSNPRIRYKTNLKTVLLKNLAIEDSGNYTCIVANRLGSDNYTFVVTVSKILKSKHPDVSHDHVVKAVTGGNFTLTCETRAKRKRGMPRFQWEKRSQMSEKVVKFKAPIQPLNLLDIKQRLKNRRTQWRFDYNETGTIVGSLTFFNVSKSDHGFYTCRTGNSLSAKIIKIVSVVVVDRSDADKFSKGNKKGSVSDDVKHYGKRKEEGAQSKEGVPLFLLITAPAVAGIICITVVLVCWRRQKKKETMAKLSRPDAQKPAELEPALKNGHIGRVTQNGSMNSLRNGLHRAPNGAAITVVHHDPVTGTRLQYISQSESINSNT